MSQLTSTINMAAGRKGLQAECFSPIDVITKLSGNNKIYFGQAVLRASGENQVKHPSVEADVAKCLGVVVTDSHSDATTEDDAAYVGKNGPVTVMKEGRIYVEVEETVSEGDSVFIRFGAKRQIQTLTLGSDMEAGNTLSGNVGGESISVDYATSQTATATAIKDALEALPNVASVVISGSNLVFTINAEKDKDATLEGFSVTGGSNQPTVTTAETQEGIFSSKAGSFRKSADNDEGSNATAAECSKMVYTMGAEAGKIAVVEVDCL